MTDLAEAALWHETEAARYEASERTARENKRPMDELEYNRRAALHRRLALACREADSDEPRNDDVCKFSWHRASQDKDVFVPNETKSCAEFTQSR